MADAAVQSEPAASGSRRKPLLLGLALALICAAAGFYVTWSGLVGPHADHGKSQATALPDIAFVPIDPVTVTLPGTGRPTIRFTAQLEVEAIHRSEVAALLPRILDVLNGYLRAVDPSRFDQAGALVRMRAQLLRRIQIVTGEGRVRDLLVTEFLVQ